MLEVLRSESLLEGPKVARFEERSPNSTGFVTPSHGQQRDHRASQAAMQALEIVWR
ncbi:MAG: hypothetical protein R2715_10290 [Ilumatobacteraceae bacterium]